jgi:serine/threonine-protein kinase
MDASAPPAGARSPVNQQGAGADIQVARETDAWRGSDGIKTIPLVSAAATDAPSVLAHECFLHGRFRLDRRLGRGSMSDVWLAHDCRLDRPVAMKIRAPDADPPLLLREAQSLAALSHPNVAGIYDYTELDGMSFLVVEYLPGGTLQQRLERGRPMADAFASRVASDIAAGLAHVHDHGVVHRDLKPSNLVFDSDDRPKIADFGIAVMRGHESPIRPDTIVGTAAYISPEQARGKPAGPASDVYAFGVVLFEMLTGALPFTEHRSRELLRLHVATDAPAVRSLRTNAPATLAALADSALARDAGARPPDGAALLRTLGNPSARRSCGMRRERVQQRVVPPGRWVVSTLALLVLAVIASGIGVLLFRLL